jgi:hypothetical protein
VPSNSSPKYLKSGVVLRASKQMHPNTQILLVMLIIAVTENFGLKSNYLGFNIFVIFITSVSV